MKKTIKINFKYFWKNFNPEDNFFTNLLRERYNVVIDPNPDFLFYSVYPEIEEDANLSKKGEIIEKISPRLYILLRKLYPQFISLIKHKKMQFPKGNFVKIFYATENVKPNMKKGDWVLGSHFEEEINHPRYMRLPMYIMPDYPMSLSNNYLIKKKINFNKIKKEKREFCNFIYSNPINFRNKFFERLRKYKRIDSPGRCMNNMPPIGAYTNSKKSRLSKTWGEEKINFIKRYKFTIAFENVSSPGWVTEKLIHPMLVNSVPIYYGHPSVVRDFNPKSFINYHDFENMEKFIEHIIKVDNDDKLYREYLEQPFYYKNRAPKHMSSKYYLEWLTRIVERKLSQKQ